MRLLSNQPPMAYTPASSKPSQRNGMEFHLSITPKAQEKGLLNLFCGVRNVIPS
jgi:hypothetical protein